MKLNALMINCSLKKKEEDSSTEKLLTQIQKSLSAHEVSSEILRSTAFQIKPGVTNDEGDGDEWPKIREKLLESDILILGTPIWMGQPSSECKRVLERLDAFLSDTDEKGRMKTYGKVAGVAVVGNEDGAHHVSAEVFQALNDVGFSLAANAVTYWVGEAMQKTDYKDLRSTPEKTANATSMMTRNLVHLAKLLKENSFPSGSKG